MEETIVIGVALDVLREVIDYQDLTITVLNDDISPIIESFRTVVSLNQTDPKFEGKDQQSSDDVTLLLASSVLIWMFIRVQNNSPWKGNNDFFDSTGPPSSFVYTEVGIHPDGFLARGTASDPDILRDVAVANWYEIPGIWWNTVERLSWTMVGKPAAYGSKFRPPQQ